MSPEMEIALVVLGGLGIIGAGVGLFLRSKTSKLLQKSTDKSAEGAVIMAAPSFASFGAPVIADYVEMLFRYYDQGVRPVRSPVTGPGKWLKGMPVIVRGFPPGPDWSIDEAKTPDEGGHFVRLRITDAQPADVQADIDSIYDTDGNRNNLIGKRLSGNLPQSILRQLESTGVYEMGLATYQSFVENA